MLRSEAAGPAGLGPVGEAGATKSGFLGVSYREAPACATRGGENSEARKLDALAASGVGGEIALRLLVRARLSLVVQNMPWLAL